MTNNKLPHITIPKNFNVFKRTTWKTKKFDDYYYTMKKKYIDVLRKRTGILGYLYPR